MFVLYCKSYRNDVLRVKRLLQSVIKFNKSDLKFYISTPMMDYDIFINEIGHIGYSWISDESIIASNAKLNINEFKCLTGSLSQQIVKAEFWRLNLCDVYLCLDSDCEFTKDFHIDDFVDSNNIPYTVFHDGEEILQNADLGGKKTLRVNFIKESALIKTKFNRQGADHDFGPAPMIWSCKVWKSFEQNYLNFHNITILNAIKTHPSEIRWYGESLLAYKAIPLHPINPLFKVYAYQWQVKTMPDHCRHLGVVRQSSWEYELDSNFSKKPFFSQLWRSIRRLMNRE